MLFDAVRDQEGAKHLHGRMHDLAEKVLLSLPQKLKVRLVGWGNFRFTTRVSSWKANGFQDEDKTKSQRKKTRGSIRL